MKKVGVLFLVCASFLTGCKREPTTVSIEPPIDFPAVLQQAKSENKFVLLEFTGSDWCPPCMAMHKNVFSKPEFKDYIKPHTIFVEVDFPNGKPQSDEQKKVNEELSQKFKTEAFPTFILLNPDGVEIWREVGGFASTPAEFISAVEAAKKKSPTKAALNLDSFAQNLTRPFAPVASSQF